MTVRSFVAAPGDAGGRLDAVAAAATGLSRSAIASLIDDGAVLVDGVARSRSYRLSGGESVIVDTPESGELVEPAAEAGIEIPVRYEDEWLLVLAKPPGLVVHPAPGHSDGTLVNALLARPVPPAGGDAFRPGIVHRLDAGTSGLMIVAKREESYERLTQMMRSHQVERRYLALIEGVLGVDEAMVDAPIGRSPRHRKKMAVVAGGREAITDVSVIERFAAATLVEARPRTGRTHQIRVHLAAAGHPVAGDDVYGRDRTLARELGLDRPFLHAAGLRFTHPMTGEDLSLSEPIPSDLASILRILKGSVS